MTPSQILSANLDRLSAKDQEFARSLLSARTPSEKQLYWIAKLGERATAEAPAAEKVVADLGPILAAFERAGRKLKQPGFRILLNSTTALRIRVAGETSRYAGDLQLTGDGCYAERAYFGRIDRQGRFHVGRDAHGREDEVKGALSAFARNPAGEAKRYARLFGRCCFCNSELTDMRSTEMGYGPICAENYGLPWGASASSEGQLELV